MKLFPLILFTQVFLYSCNILNKHEENQSINKFGVQMTLPGDWEFASGDSLQSGDIIMILRQKGFRNALNMLQLSLKPGSYNLQKLHKYDVNMASITHMFFEPKFDSVVITNVNGHDALRTIYTTKASAAQLKGTVYSFTTDLYGGTIMLTEKIKDTLKTKQSVKILINSLKFYSKKDQ